MGSNARSGLPLRAAPPTTAVLVSLDALFPTDHASAERDGLILTGWTPGVLHRWLRSATGGWIGVVTILIATTDAGTFKPKTSSCPPRHSNPATIRPRPDVDGYASNAASLPFPCFPHRPSPMHRARPGRD